MFYAEAGSAQKAFAFSANLPAAPFYFVVVAKRGPKGKM